MSRINSVFRFAFALSIVLCGLLAYAPPPVAAQSTKAVGDCARFITDLNYPDGSVVPRNTTITKRWRLYNCGSTNWSGYSVRKQYGTLGPGYFTLGSSAPNAYIDVYATFNTGSSTGRFISGYRLYNHAGQAFGDQFYFDLTVR